MKFKVAADRKNAFVYETKNTSAEEKFDEQKKYFYWFDKNETHIVLITSAEEFAQARTDGQETPRI